MELTYLPAPGHTLQAGFEHKQLHFNLGWIFSGSSTTTDTSFSFADTSLWIEFRPVEQSAYLEYKWRPFSRLALKAGLRASRYSLHGVVNPEPRISLKFFLRDNLALTGAWGRYFQYLTTANPADENLRIIDLWLPAPADKPPPQSEHFIAGIEYLAENNLLFKAEVYLKSFSNLIYLKQGFIFFLSPDAEQAPDDVLSEFLPAEAKARGLELLIRKNGGKVRGWLGYTFSQALWKSDEFDWYAPKYDRTHTLNLVADWQLNQRWHFSTAYSLSSGNPYTPLLGRLSNQGNSWLQPPSKYGYWSESRLLAGEKHAARYPFYGRWDVSFVHRKDNSRGGHREFYIQIMNVLNRANVFQYFYQEKYAGDDYSSINGIIDQESLGIERTAIPMFPFLPTIGWRYEF